MRDLAITIFVMGLLPAVVMHPWLGVSMSAWLGYMNPHRLAYGFAHDFPFSALVAGATVIGLLFSRERVRTPLSALMITWIAFVLWTGATTLMALNPEAALSEWNRFIRIQLLAYLTVVLLLKRDQIVIFAGVVAFSIGFYGIKGGIFTLSTGGHFRVEGPEDSFISGNNELALALVVALPFLAFMITQFKVWWAKGAVVLCMALCVVSVLGSYSRGALLALVAMAVVLVFRSKKKLVVGTLAGLCIAAGVVFMPAQWTQRMDTIDEYEQDGSALGRLNAWAFARNLAADHPIFGGGFQAFTKDLFLQYAPNPADHHDAHSIYFEVLAEQGYPGLVLFLSIGVLIFLTCGRVRRQCRDASQADWIFQLAGFIQVSLIGYAVGGMFLGLAYWDFLYHLAALTLVLSRTAANTFREHADQTAVIAADTGLSTAKTN